MPTGPKGERRPADVIGNAVKVMRIATGEETETLPADDGKDSAAKALGHKGGGGVFLRPAVRPAPDRRVRRPLPRQYDVGRSVRPLPRDLRIR